MLSHIRNLCAGWLQDTVMFSGLNTSLRLSVLPFLLMPWPHPHRLSLWQGLTEGHSHIVRNTGWIYRKLLKKQELSASGVSPQTVSLLSSRLDLVLRLHLEVRCLWLLLPLRFKCIIKQTKQNTLCLRELKWLVSEFEGVFETWCVLHLCI